MTKSPQHDLIIAGAGPVGLSLGLGLARAGRSVLVLEKEASTSEHSRAPIIWARTLEILGGLDVIDRFREEGIPLSRIQLWDADEEEALLSLPLHELEGETDFGELLICPQSTTEHLLCEALQQETSAQVLFSAEVTGLIQKADFVEVHYERNGKSHTATATFVAGCDGAHSTVRETLGLSFEGKTYRMKAALADIAIEQDRDLPFPRMTRKRGLATAIRLDEEHWRVIVPRQPEELISVEEHIERAVADLFSTNAFKTVWQSEFNLHKRICDRFVQNRVVLAGDAAHLRSPVGGEGMNLGIQDTASLKRALITALEENNQAALQGYSAERRSAVQSGVARITDWLTQNMLAVRPTLVVPIFRIAGFLLRIGPLRRLVMRRLSMLDDPSRRD